MILLLGGGGRSCSLRPALSSPVPADQPGFISTVWLSVRVLTLPLQHLGEQIVFHTWLSCRTMWETESRVINV